MTLTQDLAPATVPATRNPRDLVSPELFGRIVDRVQEDMPVARSYAELVVEQSLAFLATIAETGERGRDAVESKLSPSHAVDPGWHAFLAFTHEYAKFCAELTGGNYIHHLPVTPGTTFWWKSVPETVERMRALGWPVVESMWEKDASCGSTDDCNFRVAPII